MDARLSRLALTVLSAVAVGGCVAGGGSGGGNDAPKDAAVETDTEVCVPDCTDRVCGSDGCGSECGACLDEQICTGVGQCLEVPATCGDGACTEGDGETCETCPADCGACCGDGACTEAQGEHCGTCPVDCACADGESCNPQAGLCEAACVPDCAGRQCGDDGCGQDCGPCEGGDVCGGDGQCAPPPADCGDGACGEGEDCANCAADCACAAGEDCEGGRCIDAPRCGDEACNGDEDCDTCAADCGCEAGQDCQAGQCVDAPRCGDGECGGDENCESCEADCGCAAGDACVNQACTCVPACADAECGDDGCGGICGQCPDGAACAGGECVFECPDDCGELWAASCTDDGFGYRLCTPDPERPGCTTRSRRVPCGEGRLCDNAGDTCGGDCVKPEVLLLVDRSSSMLGERWAFTRATLIGNAAERTRTARLGLRTFPAQGDGCAAGGVNAPVFDARNTFDRMPEPAQVAQTPISAAFDGVEAVFGDPDEGESVILITDGDETCEDEFAAVGRAEDLRRRGIRTYVVGISRQANGELLSAIAAAGGTAPDRGPAYYVVEDAEELQAALDDIFTRLETCACADGDRLCGGPNLQMCAPDGFGFVDDQACEFNCNAAVNACFPVCDGTDQTPVCEGDIVTLCGEEGLGYDQIELCPLGCRDGVGCNPVCRPGTRRCAGNVSEECNGAGDGWDAVEQCDNCNANTGLCGAGGCAPGIDFRCGGQGVEVCAAGGQGYELAQACDCNPITATCLNLEAEASLRLVGDVPENGRLEVYHAGEWGTVCDDSFGASDQLVACRQLGYPDQVRQLNASGAGQIWMDDVGCTGAEAALADCPFAGWGEHNCAHSEDVGLECLVPEPDQAFCINPVTSWWFQANGVVRRAPCQDGCDAGTGRCVGDDGAECNDGIDNDGDGRTDFPQDPGCDGPDDPSEFDVVGPCAGDLFGGVCIIHLSDSCEGGSANAYCDARGGRVPTLAEFQAAVAGGWVRPDAGYHTLSVTEFDACPDDNREGSANIPGFEPAFALWSCGDDLNYCSRVIMCVQ